MSGHLLDSIGRDSGPILVLVDSDSQRMSKRDELLGLSEYLSHLAKALLLAEAEGHRTVGLRAALAQLHERLARTIGLVRST